MAIKPWPKASEPYVLSTRYHKSFIVQRFINPNNDQSEEYSFMRGEKDSVIIFPVTDNQEVVVIHQFRHAADNIFIELPGGNIDTDESPETAAGRELLEETGYQAKEIFRFKSAINWFDPSTIRSFYIPCLAVGCKQVSKPRLETTELIEVETFCIRKWLEIINNGLITDAKTLAITMLAKNYLDKITNQSPQ